MNLVPDTHIVLWWLNDSPELPAGAADAIADPGNICFVIAATVWEISIKVKLGKLEIPRDYLEVLVTQGFRELPISWNHTRAVQDLPNLHRDPFDRMLVAQARIENHVLVTTDPQIKHYDVHTLS